MKRLKIFSAAVSACLCALMLFNIAVYAVSITYSHEFCTKEADTIGVQGFSVSVWRGSFEDINGDVVSFGTDEVLRPHSSSYGDTVYPVLETDFSCGGLDCILVQFADTVNINGTDVTAVYSSLSVKNSGDSDAAFCPTDGYLIPLSDVPVSVGAGKSARCDYVTPVFCSGELPEDAELAAAGSFDDRMQHMEDFWDQYILLGGSCSEDSPMYAAYSRSIINDAVSGSISAASVYDGRVVNTSDSMSPFALWLMLRRGSMAEGFDTDYDLTSKAEAICSGINKYSCGYADDIYLYSDSGDPTPEGCFNALSELAACIELAPIFGISDVSSYEDSYQKLLFGTETVFLHTTGMFDGAWEVRDFKESDDLILPLDKSTTPGALCSWYIHDSALGRFDSGRLRYLAREALRLLSDIQFADAADSLLAAVHPSADGGACIGRGLTVGDVAASVAVTGFSGSGERVYAEISADGNDVIINLDCPDNVSVTTAIPFFRDNIESASCDFDAERGMLTPEPGCKSITVTLKKGVALLIEESAARVSLENALAEAEKKSTNGCTDISKREFEAALKLALAAKNAGVYTEQTKAADELNKCCANLSKLISGYTYTVGDGEITGSVSHEVMQMISLPKSGTIESVAVDGVYGEDTVLKIYALSDDGYSPDGDPLAEAMAAETDIGMSFNPGFDAEADKSYLMVLTPSDKALISVSHAGSSELLYSMEAGEVKVYDNTSLSADITVVQADRTELDALYETCHITDVSRYTRESVKNLQTAMRTAADLLRTPDADAHDCEDALWNLKLAFSSLTTYASDMKVTAASPVLYILIGITIVLLLASLVTASAAGHKKNKKQGE